MKTITQNRKKALTLVEVLVVVVVLVVLASLLLPNMSKTCCKANRISCINNQKQIGVASRLWAGDNGDWPPAQQTVVSNGWRDFLTNANQGAVCWKNYAIMSNELGQSSKVVWCPTDERVASLSFTNNFDNNHISYFVGVGANDLYPQSIAGGDRNLGPGTEPGPNCGYSPNSGQGNDVSLPLSATTCWSLKMHSGGYPTGAGNILLGDGSTQMVTSSNFNKTWLPNAKDAGNWPAGHVPATPSIRLVFP